MKKNLVLLMSAVLFAFTSCTKDNAAEGGTLGPDELSGDVVFVDVAMSRPTTANTRSKTDWTDEDQNGDGTTNSDATPDYEYGYDYENDVNSVLLVIATTNDAYIVHSIVNGILASPAEKPTTDFDFMATAKFKKSDIQAAYGENGLLKDNKQVRIYAYCNPTQALINLFTNDQAVLKSTDPTKWLDYTGSVEETAGSAIDPNSNIWANRKFLMTNAKIKTAEFPADFSSWNKYNNENSPFHLSDNNPGDVDNGKDGQSDPIYVERTAARIDFRDGSGNTESPNTYKLTGKGNVLSKGEDGVFDEFDASYKDNLNILNIELTGMSLVNMSKNYYYLRRVSPTGTSTNHRIGANETKTNYVVDTDWATKQKGKDEGGYTPLTVGTAFNFPLFGSAKLEERSTDDADVYPYNMTGWYTDKIEKVLASTTDTWTGLYGGSYHIWRYVTENTIPQDTYGGQSMQKTVQSVGIVFKGRILPGDDYDAVLSFPLSETAFDPGFSHGVSLRNFLSDNVRKALEEAKKGTAVKDDQHPTGYEYPVFYSVGGLLYAGIEDLVNVAPNDNFGSIADEIFNHWYIYSEENSDAKEFKYYAEAPSLTNESGILVQLNRDIYAQINSVEDHPEGYTIDSKLADNSTEVKAILIDLGVTIYEAENDGDTGGYYCYYFYWNRHNDNGDNGVMGPMEFATVRNNVYKLAVTKLGRLGHPGNPENDPDPVIPEDPDEDDSVYMDVKIEVLPWVVRVNDIEF